MSALLPRLRRSISGLLLLIVLVLTFVMAFQLKPPQPTAGFADYNLLESIDGNTTINDKLISRFVSAPSDRFVHAASVTRLSNGDLYAAWFGGTREGAEDVRIYGAQFDTAYQQWLPEHVLVTHETTEAALGIRVRKLGNPVVAAGPDGRLWLVYVSVSLGGWATSNLNLMTSTDNGKSWSAPKRLVMTPFFNLSTLVRGKPVFHLDGTMGLPVYHEGLAKFPEYARIDYEGRVLDKVRMDYGRDTLQPYVVTLSEHEALALLRDDSDARKVSYSQSDDGGRSWSMPQIVDMPNPNAAIAAVRYSRTELLVALNDLKKDRHRMSLYLVDNSLQRWQLIVRTDSAPGEEMRPFPLYEFKEILAEQFLTSAEPKQHELLQEYLAHWSDRDPRGCKAEGCEFRYDYPYLLQTSADQFELMYSWNKSLIKHVSIPRQWVERRRGQQQ